MQRSQIKETTHNVLCRTTQTENNNMFLRNHWIAFANWNFLSLKRGDNSLTRIVFLKVHAEFLCEGAVMEMSIVIIPEDYMLM